MFLMDANVLGFTILLISTVAAVLAGIAVFTNIAPEPPKEDPRIGVILESLKGLNEKLASSQEEIRKDLLLINHKMEKEMLSSRKETAEHVDKSVEIILKAVQDLNAD